MKQEKYKLFFHLFRREFLGFYCFNTLPRLLSSCCLSSYFFEGICRRVRRMRMNESCWSQWDDVLIIKLCCHFTLDHVCILTGFSYPIYMSHANPHQLWFLRLALSLIKCFKEIILLIFHAFLSSLMAKSCHTKSHKEAGTQTYFPIDVDSFLL